MMRLPGLEPEYRRLRPFFWLALMAVPAALSLTLLAQALTPAGAAPLSLCLFLDLTGLPCPGCGMTRGLVALLSLDFARALRYHPLSPLLPAGLVFVGAGCVSRAAARWLLVIVAPRRLLAVALCLLALGLARDLWLLLEPEHARAYVYDFSRDRGPLRSFWP